MRIPVFALLVGLILVAAVLGVLATKLKPRDGSLKPRHRHWFDYRATRRGSVGGAVNMSVPKLCSRGAPA